MTKQTKQRGFTIVELLIVVVIIAILAAITIVAYNGIQSRANNSASTLAANTVAKKVESYNAIKSTYPTDTTAAAYTTTLASDNTSTLTGTNIAIVTALSSANGKNSVQIKNCGSGAGAIVYYWDYTSATPAVTTTPLNLGNVTGTCTALL